MGFLIASIIAQIAVNGNHWMRPEGVRHPAAREPLAHYIYYSLFISEAQLSGFIIHYSFLVPSHPASQEVTSNE